MANQSLTNELQQLISQSSQGGVTVGKFLDGLDHRSHALVVLLLSLPFVVPVPIMGLSTIFGAVIIVSGLSICLGVQPWLPRKLKNKHIPQKTLMDVVSKVESVTRRTQKYVKPRLTTFAKHPAFLRLHGLMIVIAALTLALPSPPGGNIPPALATFALSIGLVEEDGLALAIGYILVLLNVILVSLIFIYGLDWLMSLYQTTKGS